MLKYLSPLSQARNAIVAPDSRSGQQLPGGGEVGAGREAGEDPLLGRQVTGRGDRLLVGDGDVAASVRPVEESRSARA